MKNMLIAVCLLLSITACSKPEYEKYSSEFDGVFDTLTIVTGFEKSREDFDLHLSVIYDEMSRLHKLYDIYNNYDGMNNAKTINDNAGIAPIEVDKDLIGLIEFGVKAYDDTNGAVNIAFGSVLKTWHYCRLKALAAPESAQIPSLEELKQAAAHTDINNIVIDKSKGTVFLKDPKMSLDLGALAKGYAVELAGRKARENGLYSGLINAGGNICAIGTPLDGRKNWNVGVQNPFAASGGEQLFDTLSLNGASVVSSGDYQRFFMASGKVYHHIIDPKTLMPANRYSGVTIVHPDSGIADMLSTSVFILPQEEGRQLVDRFGAQAIWIFKDESFQATDGYKNSSKLFGFGTVS